MALISMASCMGEILPHPLIWHPLKVAVALVNLAIAEGVEIQSHQTPLLDSAGQVIALSAQVFKLHIETFAVAFQY